MGVLSDASILEKIYSKQIVIDPFLVDSLQPSSLDLTLGADFSIPRDGITVQLPYTSEQIETWFKPVTVDEEHTLAPGQFVLAQVREKIALPTNLTGHIQNRNSLIRLGLNVGLSSYINPGYSGRLPIAIHNLGTFTVKLVPGIRICQLVLTETTTATRGYGHRTDAKYQNEDAITLSKLPEDQEIAEYVARHGQTPGALASYLNQRIAERAQQTLEDLTPEQRKSLGIG